jgi:hypothetical protein
MLSLASLIKRSHDINNNSVIAGGFFLFDFRSISPSPPPRTRFEENAHVSFAAIYFCSRPPPCVWVHFLPVFFVALETWERTKFTTKRTNIERKQNRTKKITATTLILHLLMYIQYVHNIKVIALRHFKLLMSTITAF